MALSDNLVSYWKLDETSGTTATDAAGSNDGTVSGATVGQSGIINYAYSFDGTNDYISFSNRLADASGAFSLSFWVYVTSTTSGSMFHQRGSSLGDWSVYYLAGIVRFDTFTGTSGTGTYDFDSTTSLTLNQWNHIVITKPTGLNPTIHIYVNNSSEAITSIVGAVGGGTGYRIGTRGDSSFDFTGLLDEIGVWTKELSSSEVSQLYNSGAGLAYPFAADSTQTPSALTTSLTLNAPETIVTHAPSAQSLSFSLNSPSYLLEELPSGLALSLSIPTPSVITTFSASALTLTSAVNSPAVMIDEAPSSLSMTFSIPAPSVSIVQTITINPDPLTLSFEVNTVRVNPVMSVGTGDASSRFLKTYWPIETGLTAGTTKQKGRTSNLVAQVKRIKWTAQPKEVQKDWPVEKGLAADQKHEGRKIRLKPVKNLVPTRYRTNL